MRREDIAYYHARAEQELTLGQAARHEAAARAHFLIAGHYLDLVYSSPFAPRRPEPPIWRRSGVSQRERRSR
jgi:hypothetical protein